MVTAHRGIEFINPALEEGSTHTLLMGLRMLKPGEVAWAHRHTFSAIRFAVEGGPGLATVTDGEVCTMENYDLVLTPRWCWHDHHNSTQDHVTWFDALDIGLINLLNVNVYEPYGDERQPQRQNPLTMCHTGLACCVRCGKSDRSYGSRCVTRGASQRPC